MGFCDYNGIEEYGYDRPAITFASLVFHVAGIGKKKIPGFLREMNLQEGISAEQEDGNIRLYARTRGDGSEYDEMIDAMLRVGGRPVYAETRWSIARILQRRASRG